MNTVYTATVLDTHRAADLQREHEMLRTQRERGLDPTRRPSAFAVVTGWFRRPQQHPVSVRPAAAR